MATLGGKLRALREESGRTQREMAELLSVNRVSYTQYENDKRTPPPDTLKKIADIFNVSVDYLLGGNPPILSAEREKMPKDMKKYLEQSEVIFDGDVYHLDDEGREMVRQALKMAFLAAKEANKRKKK